MPSLNIREQELVVAVADEISFFIKKMDDLQQSYNSKTELSQLYTKYQPFIRSINQCMSEYIGTRYKCSNFELINAPERVLSYAKETFHGARFKNILRVSSDKLFELQRKYSEAPTQTFFSKLVIFAYPEDEKYKFYKPIFFLNDRLRNIFYKFHRNIFLRGACPVRFKNTRSRLVRPCFCSEITCKEELFKELNQGRLKQWLVTLDVEGRFKMAEASRGVDEVNHCDLPSGKDVICAGEVNIDTYRSKLIITNMSGSYSPGTEGALANMVLVLLALDVKNYAEQKNLSVEIIFHYNDNSDKYLTKNVTPLFRKMLDLTPDAAIKHYQWGLYDNLKFYSVKSVKKESIWRKYGSIIPPVQRAVHQKYRLERNFLQWSPVQLVFPQELYK